MPVPGVALARLGFLTIGLFDGDDPGPGHQTTLEIIELGERLGFDSAWLRHRHLQYGISSPVAVLAAASQRTSRIDLGTAVIPLGWENPLRLAEDLATVDVLSGGRLNPGISAGPPRNYEDVREALYPDTGDDEDFSYRRVERLLRLVDGDRAAQFQGTQGFEEFSNRVQPYSPGLRGRLWYGGAGPRSARLARWHRHELPAQRRGRGRETRARRRPLGLRRDPARPHPGLPGRPPRRAGRPGVPGPGGDPHRPRQRRPAREVRGLRGGPDAAHRPAAGAGPDAVRPGPDRHLGRDRRPALRPRRLPRRHRGRLRPAVHLRPRGLRADPHRHRREARPRPGLGPGRLNRNGKRRGSGPWCG